MSRMILRHRFRDMMDEALRLVVEEAERQPTFKKRQGGAAAVMANVHCSNFIPLVNSEYYKERVTDFWLSTVYNSGMIQNSSYEQCCTYSIALAKIANCEEAVKKGFYYSGIPVSLPTESKNGFTDYIGACCFRVVSQDLDILTPSERSGIKGGKWFPVVDIYSAGSGGSGVEDLTAALAPEQRLKEVFSYYGFEILPLGQPPVELPSVE